MATNEDRGQAGEVAPNTSAHSNMPRRKPASQRGSRARIRVAVAAVVVVLATASWFAYDRLHTTPGGSLLIASGTLESDETLIAAQVSGAITTLPADQGSSVSAGQVLATLDDRLIQLQIQEADGPSRRVLEMQQAEDYVLRAPIDGLVTRVPAHIGEIALPGETLLAIANPAQLKLTLYVREADLAQVFVGQHLGITADPFPNRTFDAQVTSINSQAEFTPRNIQTQTDRLNLVFGVQARVTNTDQALKAGMPVDARFEPSTSQ